MLKKVSSYIKNVGRSALFSLSDVMAEDNKFLYEFKETNQQIAKNAYASVKNYKQTFAKLDSSFKTSKIYQAADIGMRAIFEDLRTGKFYNKERIDEVQTNLSGFDMSDDFDMEEFEKSMKEKDDITGGDKAIISTLANTSRQNAELVSGTVARSTEAIIGNQRASTKLLYAQNIQLIGGVHSAIESLNGVGRTVNGTNTMLKTLADNQKKFYETTNKQLSDLTALMKEMTEMQRNLYADKRAAQQKSGNKGPGYDDIIGSNGALNIQQYIKNVKKNAGKKLDEYGLGMLLNGFGEDSNMLAQFTASPLQFIPELLIRGFISKDLKKATKSFNDSLSGVFSTLIARLNNLGDMSNDNVITKTLGEIFGVKIKTKTSIDTNKYNKGPVPFDGIVRKSIVDVIPGYLRRIEAALTGSKGKAFDYDSGRWVELSDIKKRFDEDFDRYKENTFAEFTAFRDELLKNFRMGTREQQKMFEENQKKILRDMYDHNGDWTRYTKRGDEYRSNLAAELGVDEADLQMFAQVMKAMKIADPKRAKKIQYSMADNAIRAKQSRTQYMQNLEDRGGGILGTAMEDIYSDKHLDKHGIPLKGTLGAGILKVRDEYNHDMFHYLRSLDENVKWIQRFVEMNEGLGGGGGKPRKGRKVQMPSRSQIQQERGTYTPSERERIAAREDRESDRYDASLDERRHVILNYYDEDLAERIAGETITRGYAMDNERAREASARSWFRELFDDGSKSSRQYSSDRLIDQLKEADSIGEKYGLIKKSMEKLAQTPMKMLTHVITKADESVYHFMFGDADDEVDEDGNPIRGLLAKTIHEMKNTFSKLNQWLNEKLLDPLKAKLDEWGIHSFTDALDKVTGGRFSDAKNAIADTVFGAKDEHGKRHGGWIEPMRGAWRRNLDRFTEKEYRSQAALRKKVAASDKKYGEFKTRDLSNTPLGLMEDEAEYDTGMFHSFGTAGRAKKDMLSMLSEGEYLIDSKNNVSRVTAEQAKSPQFVPKGTTIYNPADAWTRAAQSSLEKANLANYINSNAEAAEGTDKASAGEAKEVNVALHKWLAAHSYDNAGPEAKKWVEGMTDSAAKTGIGALTGFFLGNPLLGATFGAIAGIAKNNSKINEFLFGGEKDDGLISKKTQEWLKESMPRAKNFGAIGAIAGLLTGLGPIPGLLLGSATAFASKNEEFMTTFFGEPEDRERRKEKLKKALPRMGIGAAAGALLGPFGLLGGAALGAAGGLFTTTDTFDQLMLGEKDENGNRISGGIMGAVKESFVEPLKNWAEDFKTRSKEFIRDYVTDPIKNAIKPIGAAMKHIAKDAIMFIPNMINNVFTNYLGIPLGDFLRDKVFTPMGKLAKGILTLPATLLKGAIMLPGKIIGGIGNKIRESQIRRGTADYMSAEERIAYREQHANKFSRSLFHPFRVDKMRETDQRLANATTESIESMLASMNTVLDTEAKLKAASRKAQRNLASFVDQYFHDKLFRGAKTRILKALDKGDLQGALKIASKATDKDGNTLSGDKFAEFQEGLTELWNAARDLKGRMAALGQKRDRKSALAETQKQLANLGIKNIKLNTVRDQQRFVNMLSKEKRAKQLTLDDDRHLDGALLTGRNEAIDTKIVEVLANLANVSQSLLSAANAFKDSPKEFAESSKGLTSVYEDLDAIAKDETVNKGMRDLASHAAKHVKASAFVDNQNKAKAAKFGNRIAKDGNTLKADRIRLVRSAGIEPDLSGEAGKYWSMNDEKINQIFKLFKRNSTFDINTAIKCNLSNKYFYERFRVALLTTSEFMPREYVELVNSMHGSKQQFRALKMAQENKVKVFDRTIYTPAHIKAIIGPSKDALDKPTAKKVYKLIADWTRVYGAPSPGQIQSWFIDWNAAQNAMAKLGRQKAEDKEAAKAAKAEAKANKATESAETIFSNANADEGTEKVSIFSLFKQNRENRKKYKDTVKGIKADLKAGVSAADILARVSDMKFTLEDIKAINTKTAQASVEEVSLTKEEKKAQKKKEKEKRKADRKARGNLWERMNAGVEEFGDKAANAGTNFMTMLTHPIKTLKAAHKGSKEAFEEGKQSKKGYTSIIDLLQGIKGEVSNQTEEIKKQDFEDGKTPLWKKILGAIFGKTLLGGALKLVGVPLAVGLVKNKAWPWIKKTAWPWMYEKLLGDPNVKGDGLLGRFDVWFKEHVVPVLFGEKNEDGVWTKGWFSGAANFWEQKVSPFLFGRKGADGTVIEKGFIGKAQDWIKDASYIGLDGINLLASWLLNKQYNPVTDFARQYFGNHDFSQQDKGSSGFFKMILENWADGAGTMVEFMTKTILANLPDILVGLGKGIVDGIGAWFTGKNDTAAKNAVFKAYDFNQITNNAGSIETNVSSGNKLITVESHLGAIGGGDEQNPNYAKNAADYGVAKNQVATGGKVSELVKSGQKIYNNGMDVTDEMAELNEWWENRDTSDTELSKAVELARNNLVILPVDCFESEDEFANYFDSVFGEGSVEYYGWDVLKSFHEPILVAQDSEAYKEIINRATRGERLGQAALKYILTGGKVGRALPALMRGGAKVLNTVAKLSGKMGMVGKIVGAGIKGVSWVTTKVTNIVQSAAKFKLGEKVAQGALKTTENITEFIAKHPWLQKNLAKITDFFSKLFNNNDVLGKIAKFMGKPISTVKGMITTGKIAEKSAKFGKWICEKFPNIVAKAGGHAVGVALFFVEVALVTWAFLEGYGDAKNVLAINSEPSEGEALLAGFVNAVNELLLGRIIPTSDIAQWFANEILIGWFDIKNEYTKKVKIAKERVDAYNAANNTDLNVKEYNKIFYPSAWQEMEKDFEKRNQAIADAWDKDGLGGALGQIGQNFVDFWANWWSGLTSGRTLYGHGKYGSGKGHMLPAQLPILDASSMLPMYGTGHIDQRSSNMRYNAPGDTIYQTVADSGCAPAAAATVINQYGKGKLEDAAKYSLKNGYKEPNGGTYPGFFGDYLGTKGIGTQYETTSEGVMNNLAHGQPVIMMGTGNGSGTPYDGANGSHYVTATGLDRNGNMIIEDPDSRVGRMRYNPKAVLDRTSIAISTHPGRGKITPGHHANSHIMLPKLNRTIFGRGTYRIDQIDQDGLQDFRVWKDPGDNKDAYVSAIERRIHDAARFQTNGLYYKYSRKVAEAAVNAGIETGLDPAFMLAIGTMESGHGTTPTAINKLNFWGWNYNNKTWEAGASDFSDGTNGNISKLGYAFLKYARLMLENYYDKGQKCLYQLYNNGGNHQYSGNINDITTDWVVQVAYIMKQIHDAVGQNDTNLSWHDPSGKVTLLTDLAGAFYKTAEGYSGSASSAISGDISNTTNFVGETTDNNLNTKSSGSNKSFVSMFADWGKKLLKSTFGGLYDLLFGGNDDSDSSSSGSSYSTSGTTGYYDENGNYIQGAKYINAENATSWFEKTLKGSHVSNPYAEYYDRLDLGNGQYLNNYWHKGIDFAAPKGTPILTPVSGYVKAARLHPDFGYYVNIEDGDDNRYHHIFGHMANMPDVQEGKWVERGTQIGVVGSSGKSNGNHLHYEIDDDKKPYNKPELSLASINPDTDYDWSKYYKRMDPETGEDLSEMSDITLIDRVDKENEKFMKKYQQIKDPNGRQASLESYLREKNDIRDELISRRDNLRKHINGKFDADRLNAMNDVLNFSIEKYYRSKGLGVEMDNKSTVPDTDFRESAEAQQIRDNLAQGLQLNTVTKKVISDAYRDYLEWDQSVNGQRTRYSGVAADTSKTFQDFFRNRYDQFFNNEIYPRPERFSTTGFLGMDKYNFNWNTDIPEEAFKDWNKYLDDNPDWFSPYDKRFQSLGSFQLWMKDAGMRYKDGATSIRNVFDKYIKEVNRGLDFKEQETKDQLKDVLLNPDHYDPVSIYYGKGKGGSTKNISKQGVALKKINTLASKISTMKSKDKNTKSMQERLADETKQYVKKYNTNPFAIDYGKGKKEHLPPISVARTTKTYHPETIKTDTSGMSDTSIINYSKMILTIIEVLSKIADNTEKLDRVVELLRRYGPNLGIDTSGLGKGKSNADTARSIKATIQNHKTDPSWAFSAMNHMNQEAVSDNFMESVLALARE